MVTTAYSDASASYAVALGYENASYQIASGGGGYHAANQAHNTYETGSRDYVRGYGGAQNTAQRASDGYDTGYYATTTVSNGAGDVGGAWRGDERERKMLKENFETGVGTVAGGGGGGKEGKSKSRKDRDKDKDREGREEEKSKEKKEKSHRERRR